MAESKAKKAETKKDDGTKKESGVERRTITGVASQEWLDPFSGKWISSDLRVSPHSGAKRVERFVAELKEKKG